jgi:ankyrin repeat protein
MAAVLRGKANIVFHLLKAGADPMIGESSGYHPPHGAAFQGRPDIMQILIDHGLDVNTFHSGDGFLPLHRACWGQEQRHAATLLVLLKHGIDPGVKSKDGKTCREMTQNDFVLSVLDSWTPANNEL